MSFRDWLLAIGVFNCAVGGGLLVGSLLSVPAGIGAGLQLAGSVLVYVGIRGLEPIGQSEGEG